ncbi:MAG: hypothetical protein MR270_07755 [Erysipelotrichaceae bacterium]|nr:hypothetical protein [Erysipelotrichaceae bacterium]
MKKNKVIIGLSCALIIGVVVLIIAGILTDIFYWKWVYEHREPDEVGHGVPVFSFLGIIVAIVYQAIMAIIITIKARKIDKKNKETIEPRN